MCIVVSVYYVVAHLRMNGSVECRSTTRAVCVCVCVKLLASRVFAAEENDASVFECVCVWSSARAYKFLCIRRNVYTIKCLRVLRY